MGTRIIITLLLALGCSGIASAQAAKRPNVLFIAVDDLRTELGCYGSPIVQSPNIDRLAKRGLVFERAYCQQAVCSPSRSSLMTGTRPDTTKVWDLETHFRVALPKVVTLSQHFKNEGYFVQGMGKIYHPGFDDRESWSVPWQNPRGAVGYGLEENRNLIQRKRQEAKKAGLTGKALSGRAVRGPAFEAADVPDETFADGRVAQMAIAALGELKQKEQPFFLAVGFVKPHLPFVAPKKYWDLYDPAKIELASNPFPPKDAPAYAVQSGGELRAYEGIPRSGPIPDDLARQLKHGYYASISYMDAQLGKVLDELDRLGLSENTIIVLWGDHGWKLGEHAAWCKHTNVENDANAPLILSVPGMKTAGSRTRALVEFVDIYPTLADLAGLSLPSHLEGVSMKPLLDDTQRPWKKAAFNQYPRGVSGAQLMGYSMRTNRYRFTRWVRRNNPEHLEAVELYDHQTDPQENQNIASRPENAALVARLHEQMNAGWEGNRPPR